MSVSSLSLLFFKSFPLPLQSHIGIQAFNLTPPQAHALQLFGAKAKRVYVILQ